MSDTIAHSPHAMYLLTHGVDGKWHVECHYPECPWHFVGVSEYVARKAKRHHQELSGHQGRIAQ